MKDREILISREFNFPRELVFDAFTDPAKIGQWWGPNGFTTTIHSMDFKEGGRWEYTMHGPDGIDYPNWVLYQEIVKPEKILYDHGGEMGEPAHFKTTILFKDLGDKTRVTLNMVFPTKEARDNTIEFGAIEGGNQTLSRLESFLKTN